MSLLTVAFTTGSSAFSTQLQSKTVVRVYTFRRSLKIPFRLDFNVKDNVGQILYALARCVFTQVERGDETSVQIHTHSSIEL